MHRYIIITLYTIFFGSLLFSACYARNNSISMNSISVEELVELENGVISNELAQTIVNYRKEHGPYTHIKDLLNVPGVKSELLDILVLQEKNGDVVYDYGASVSMPTY